MNASRWTLGQYPMKNKVLKIQNLKKYLYVKKVFEDIKTWINRTRTFYDIYRSNLSHFFYNFYSIRACADTWPTESTFCKIAISVLFACYLHTITQHIILKQSDVEKLSKFLCFLKLTPNAFLLILKKKNVIHWMINSDTKCLQTMQTRDLTIPI